MVFGNCASYFTPSCGTADGAACLPLIPKAGQHLETRLQTQIDLREGAA
jgi:hypothetical protein